MGWSPLGVAPVWVSQLHHDQHIKYCLPMHKMALFSPEPKSVLVMDNASFHHSEKTTQLCADAGVKLVFLPLYSLDLNPIKEFFAELKAFIKWNWQCYEEDPGRGFGAFLEWCVSVVDARSESAEGHFHHAGLAIEKL